MQNKNVTLASVLIAIFTLVASSTLFGSPLLDSSKKECSFDEGDALWTGSICVNAGFISFCVDVECDFDLLDVVAFPIPLAVLRGHGCHLAYVAAGNPVHVVASTEPDLVSWLQSISGGSTSQLEYIDVYTTSSTVASKGQRIGIKNQRYYIEEHNGLRTISFILVIL